MQKVKQSYASKKEPSEAEIDSIDDIICRNDSSKKEPASEQVHVKTPDDVPEKFHHMKNREALLRDGLFKKEYTSYQPILQVKDDFSEQSDKLQDAKFEVAGSSMYTNDKLRRDELFGKDISRNSIDLLNKKELMRKEHLINRIYVTFSKSLYRRMQYINECGLLRSYGKEAQPENDKGVYITENNRLFKKINIISADGFTPDEDASAIVDEYAENLDLTCQNSLFKKIHHQGEGDLENIKELLKRKEKEEARESVKKKILPQERKHTIYIYLHEKEKDREKILPQERKHTIYIYLHEKEKDRDPDKNKNDWVIYKRIEDRKVKVELLEDVHTMNKLDVTAVDSVYKETEETLMRSVLEPAKKMVRPHIEVTEESLMKNVLGLQEKLTKSNIKETMRKVAKYGIPGVLAMVVLPFLVMEYLKIPGASAFLEAELIGAKAGLSKAVEHIPEVVMETTTCVVETVVSSFISWLLQLPTSAPEKNDTSCAIHTAEKTVKAMAEGADHGTAVGTSIGMSNTWIQFGLEIAMAAAILIIVEVIFQIFLYLDNRGHLDFIAKYRRRFKRFMVEREYKMRKPKSF
ncbi:hypothetical protein C922_05483 [Plasmodium inui San Antonio 1]|uniref:Uncharacterized protein n=1 Tax=Plasmodium inui San Antonio 1 TaxID=1237626 RepID=W7A4V9_9APIC|nr:hypothetical protein C922_05483 [Plasmodium inui San Antonio 1]EUD64134.1 hypothetical protein C922_05483 [Plasmodium inui San Antonio 1]